MTTQRIFLQLTTSSGCPLSVPRNTSRVAPSWSILALQILSLSPKKHTIREFGSSIPPPPKDPTPLLQFSNARLAYPKERFRDDDDSSAVLKSQIISGSNNCATASPLVSSELYLQNFSIALPNWKDASDVKQHRRRQSDYGGEMSDRRGGIAIVGKNGSGKTLFGKTIIAAGTSSGDDPNPYVLSGNVDMPLNDHHRRNVSSRQKDDRHLLGRAGRTSLSSSTRSTTVAHVSFDSHRRLLEERDEKSGADSSSVTAFKAIASAGHAPGRLNPAARFLVIRFGLYPMLHRTVDTLSTGEIRKVLLARALSTKPSLLILDHAFDGLDLPSRKILQELVSKTIKGFTNDLLVQGVSSKDTADKTQVVLMTHRAEELDEIQELDTVAWRGKQSDDYTWNVLRRSSLVDNDYPSDAENTTWSSGNEVLHRAMGLNLTAKSSKVKVLDIDWEDPNLPSEESVQKWWSHRATGLVSENNQEVLVQVTDLTVQKGDAILLKNLTWTVRKGERWIVGGGNGAGKSTLSRLLALHPTTMTAEGDSSKEEDCVQIFPNRDLGDLRTAIGWVSTESHMQHQERCSKSIIATTRDFIVDNSRNASWEKAILPVLEWLGILEDASGNCLLDRQFHTLSQGEQKMLLIAASLVARPPLLILDEPCQGLDLENRARLLQVLETICRSTDIAIIYITHHLDEELVPSISHALHLKDQREVYKGPIEDYIAEEYFDNGEVK